MDSISIIIDIRPTITYLLEYIKDSYNLFCPEFYIKRYTKKEIGFHKLFIKSDEIKRKLDEKYKVILLKSDETKINMEELVISYFNENEIIFEQFDYSDYIETISPDLIIKHQEPKNKCFIPSPPIDCFGQCSEIIPGLYLSGLECVPFHLKKFEILNVLSVLKMYMPTLDETYNHMKIEIHDDANQFIEKYFDQAHKFIDEALEKNERILVHCYAGISRSASIVISYLMKKNKITYEKAYEMVKKNRGCISPNLSFYSSLKQYEKQIL